MSRVERRYWDSTVFLALIKKEPGRVQECEAILRSAAKGDCEIWPSAITLAEVVRPRHKGTVALTEAEESQIGAFFANPLIHFVDFNPAMGALSRSLQWRFGLHVRDAIHVACAIGAKVDVIESYDPDFLRLDPKQVTGCPPLQEPKAKALPLFDQPDKESNES
jgi:predicted nucleic acid-binding protein